MANIEDKALEEAEDHLRRLLTAITLNDQETRYVTLTAAKVHEVLESGAEALPESDRLSLRRLVLPVTLATLIGSPVAGRDYGPEMYTPLRRGAARLVDRTDRAAHAVARLALAFVWLWHGLMPKLVFRHPDEATMLTDAGVSDAAAWRLVTVAGVAEIVVGLATLALWRARWPLWLTLIAMPAALLGVAVTSPRYLTHAFNPASLNVATFALALIALLTSPRRDRASSVPRS